MSEEFTDFEGTIMSIDPSGRGEDKTAYAVLKMLHGVLYLTDIGALTVVIVMIPWLNYLT